MNSTMDTRPCPHCQGALQGSPLTCPHCNADLNAEAVHAAHATGKKTQLLAIALVVVVVLAVILAVAIGSGPSKQNLLKSFSRLTEPLPSCANYPCKKALGNASWTIERLPDSNSGVTSIPLRGPTNIMNTFLFQGLGVFRDRLPTLFLTWGDKMKGRASSAVLTTHMEDQAGGYTTASSTKVPCPEHAQCLASVIFRKGKQIAGSYTMLFNRRGGQVGGQAFSLLIDNFRKEQARLPKMAHHLYATQIIKGAGASFEALADVRLDDDYIFGVERNLTDTTTGPSRWRQWYFVVNVFAIRRDALTEPLFKRYDQIRSESPKQGGKCRTPCETCLKRHDCAEKTGEDRWKCEADCFEKNVNCCKSNMGRPLLNACGCWG